MSAEATAINEALVKRRALQRGAEMARRVFEKRGNHSEAHMREAELAALLALAFELGVDWACR